jgi:hypothetical protein
MCTGGRGGWGGGEGGSTVTVNVALTGLLASSQSVAVQVTVVVPIGKTEPEAGAQLTAGVSPPSSLALGGVGDACAGRAARGLRHVVIGRSPKRARDDAVQMTKAFAGPNGARRERQAAALMQAGTLGVAWLLLKARNPATAPHSLSERIAIPGQTRNETVSSCSRTLPPVAPELTPWAGHPPDP